MATVTKESIEKDVRIFRMISKDGFKNVFWETVKEFEKNGITISHEKVFDIINDEYHQRTGVFRYKNYESFKSSK